MTNETKQKSRKKWMWIGAGVLALVIIAVLAAPRFIGGPLAARQQSESAATGETVTAFTGDLSANATASGQVQARRDARLALPLSGDVAEIYVSVGDEVAAGEPLLKLDTDALERAVESARQSLQIQEANLAAVIATPTASNLAAMQAAVDSAQAQLDELLDGPSEEDIAASEANVRAAQANVWAASEQLQLAQSGASDSAIASAQAELLGALSQQESTQELYDNLTECFDVTLPDGSDMTICPGLGDPEEQTRYNLETANANVAAAQAKLDALLSGPDADAVAIAQASLAAANAQLEAAEANHQLLLNGATAAQIASVEASLAQARSNLEALQDGASEAQVAMAEIGVEQARIALEKAERNLADATLTAPFAGVVTAVYVNEGETANGVLVELADNTSLEVVLDVDEVDIGDIAVGQPATLILETWPDEEIDGSVILISPRANENSSGVVNYQVYLSMGETDLPVLVGMTANADLLTQNFENVLLVPNEAINADRSKGRFWVNRVTTDADGNETIEEVDVVIGLRDGRNTQILSGLNEGDVLIVGNAAPRVEFGPGGDSERRGPTGGGAFGG
jgi:HlyD family secretion protein